MAGNQVAKILLHASAKDGAKTVRWVVAAFANTKLASQHAALVKRAHVSGVAASILELDPNAAKDASGAPLTPVKLTAQSVPYNPSLSGLDTDDALDKD